MNVLVSGIASDIGFGAGRILREWGWIGSLHGIDVQAEHPGLFVFDNHAVSPRANAENYLNWVSSYIEKNKIKLFIPTSEAEIKILSELGVEEIAGSYLLISNQNAVKHCLDKYSCMRFLNDHGVRVPENGIVGKTLPTKFPVIVKPREGQGSKQIQQFRNLSLFLQYATKDYIWQEYLTPEDQEYTCPVYHSEFRGTQLIVLRRTLAGGLTGRGEVVNEPRIERYVSKIAHHMKLDGVINIQLRLTSTGPCLFEINPRLSSTLVFRDKMGFSDLRWWIQDRVGIENTPPISNYVAPKPGTRFYRGAQEYITPRQSKK